MKKVLFFISILSFITASASEVTLESLKKCSTYPTFIMNGWKVQDPALFDKFEQEIVEKVRVGHENGSIIFDMSGPIEPRYTVNNQYLLLDAISWDNLNTHRDVMFGDFAFLEVVNENHDMAELRWFDGKHRNVVINPKFLKCFSEAAPFVENSVL